MKRKYFKIKNRKNILALLSLLFVLTIGFCAIGTTLSIAGKVIIFGGTHTITFDYNDGVTEPTTKTIKINGTYGELPNPTREKYDFLGWYTEIDAGEQIKEDTKVGIVISETLYAHWEKQKINLTYQKYNSDEETIEKINLDEVTILKIGEEVTDKDFIGWETTVEIDISNNQKFDFNNDGVIDENDVNLINELYNNDTINNDCPFCDINDDGTIDTIDIEIIKQFINHEDVNETCSKCDLDENGYVDAFDSYLINAFMSSTGEVTNYKVTILKDQKIKATRDLTLMPIYEDKKITITFNALNGNINDDVSSKTTDITVKKGEAITGVPTAIYYGYNFLGWYTEENGQGDKIEENTIINYDNNITAIPQYQLITYTITYDNNGGSGCTTQTGNIEDGWPELCTPTKSGYQFAGWYSALTGGTQFTINSTIEDVTVYARWINVTEPLISVLYNESTGTININATDDEGISNMTITTTSSEPTSYDYSVSSISLPITTYNSGTYYIWAKDTSSNVTSKKITVNQIVKQNYYHITNHKIIESANLPYPSIWEELEALGETSNYLEGATRLPLNTNKLSMYYGDNDIHRVERVTMTYDSSIANAYARMNIAIDDSSDQINFTIFDRDFGGGENVLIFEKLSSGTSTFDLIYDGVINTNYNNIKLTNLAIVTFEVIIE